ncbi:MAG TPA: multidrug transporter [Bacilli bacterium]|nr:multidrug transporter [Bacilli bacterium]
MKSILKSIKTFGWRLWLVLAATLLIPATYQTVRIFFLGDMPGDWGVNIASQLAWINLLYEIIQEAFILPLFFLLGKSLGKKDELENKLRTGLLISGGAYVLLSIIIIIFARPLCTFMASDPLTIDATVAYIRLETIAATLSILYKFLIVLFVTMKKDKYMYIILVTQMALSVLLDTFLISKLPFSADLGVNGIAIGNIVVSIVVLGISFLMLRKEGLNVFGKKILHFGWLKEYGRIGAWSGLESFVRNIAFMLMISRLINVISEQGNFWVANNFIWTWLLLPATALYDVIKKETAEDKKNIETKTLGYLVITALFSTLWFASIPLWKPFLTHVMNVQNVDTVFYLALIQSGFYVLYMFNCVFDGTIYGRGKTSYMLIQSIFTNSTYYVTMFILWRVGIFVPTLTSIAIMFGVGMALDLIPTIGCYLYLLKNEKASIKWNLVDSN